jgi:hypothetical protein
MRLKKILKRIIIALGFLVSFLICFYGWMGGFKTIEITESEEGPFYFVYQELPGQDYAGVEKITNELNSILEKEKIGRTPFDVFQTAGSGQLNEIGFMINDAVNETFINDRTKFKEIPKALYLKTSFPFKNRFSYIVGYMKINPALQSHRSKNGYKDARAITINQENLIIYLQEIIK